MFMKPKKTRTSNILTATKPHIGDCNPYFSGSNCSGHIGLTVPDVKAALAHLEKYNVEVFKPLGVASNETIPVPDGMTLIVPGYADVYKQIAMIRVLHILTQPYNRIPMFTLSNWSPRVSRNIRYKPEMKLSQ
jgi:hypothetical protein